MSNLTITFQQMFLLVNKLDGAVVLTPSAGHTATISGPIFDSTIALDGVDILIARDSNDFIGTPTLRPGARYLPFLDYVFHAAVAPNSDQKSMAVPSNVSARVLLSGGYLTELPAADKDVADVQWQFITGKKLVMLTQALTDRLRFTLPLDPGVKYELVIRGNGTEEQRFPIPDEGADLILLNADTSQAKKSSVDGWYTLTEYALLYNLTSASKFVTLYPYPTAYIGIGGGNQPICGGGQTDDGGDDPPPPPPVR